MKKVVYILEYSIYNMYGKYDEKNLIQRKIEYYDYEKRQFFLQQWNRIVEDNFHYDDIKAYGFDYSGSELNLDLMNSGL